MMTSCRVCVLMLLCVTIVAGTQDMLDQDDKRGSLRGNNFHNSLYGVEKKGGFHESVYGLKRGGVSSGLQGNGFHQSLYDILKRGGIARHLRGNSFRESIHGPMFRRVWKRVPEGTDLALLQALKRYADYDPEYYDDIQN